MPKVVAVLVSFALAVSILTACTASPTPQPPTATPSLPLSPSLPASPTSNPDCPANIPSDPPWICRKGPPASTTQAVDRGPAPTRSPATSSSAPTGTPWPPYVPVSAAESPAQAPPPPAACPVADDSVPLPPLAEIEDTILVDPPILEAYLEYFDLGGQPARLPPDYRPILEKDFTGDLVPELTVEVFSGVFVLGCESGHYVTLLSVPFDWAMWIPHLWLASDGNGNGLVELVIEISSATQGGADFQVFEWAGTSFESILGPSDNAPFRPHVWDDMYSSQVVHPEFSDIDNDGRVELLFLSGIPPWTTYRDFLPWREQIDVFEWDGHRYVPYQSLYSPPQYRFQAIQDGDRETLFRQYDAALASYQDAIFSDKLSWWSPERKAYLQEEWDADMAGTEPLSPPPTPDSNEYPNLAAYSRFRIMLLHALRGWTVEAETVHQTLVTKYPTGSPGSLFAEMAVAFMDRYNAGGSIADSCNEAVEVAESNDPGVLAYLGSDYHGLQSAIGYSYKDLCPIGFAVPEP